MLTLLIILAALYLLALQGRRSHPKMDSLRGWRYAHRGLHNGDRPENSMAAFRAALEHGYGIELDIHLLKDGNLAVMHDSDLQRTTGQTGKIENLTTDDLKNYPLQGSDQTIPEFKQVLELFAGKAPLIVELKTDSGNYAALTEAVCNMLDTYQGPYCIESFDPYVVYWLKKHRPDIIRGQLSENFLKSNAKLPWLLKFICTYYLENFLIKPDFIAYRYQDRKNLSNTICRKLWGIQGVSWTLKTPEEYATATQEGWIPIFEGFIPEK